MKKTLYMVLGAALLLLISAPHAEAAVIASQPDSTATPSHYWHSDGSSGAYLALDPSSGAPGYPIGVITTTSNVLGIHIKAAFTTDGAFSNLPTFVRLFDESGNTPYACSQPSFAGYAYGTPTDAQTLSNPLTQSQFEGTMVDMYFQCALGNGHDQTTAGTSYRLYLYPVSTVDITDIYVAMGASGVPFYEVSDDGSYPPPPPPIVISTPQPGTSYFSTDTIIPAATFANLASYTSVIYLLNGTPVDPALPLPIATLPSGTSTLVIAATDSTGSITYATSTFMVVHQRSPLTVTANNKSIVKGSAIPALTATLSGFVTPDTASSNDVTGAASCTTPATSASPAGTYPITCTVGTLSSTLNYTFSTFVAGTLTITPPVVVDTQAPVITITSPLKSGLYAKTDTVYLTATVTDQSAIATTTYWFGSKKINPAVALPLSTVTTPSIQAVSVSAKDIYGNTSTTTVKFFVVKATNSCILDIVSVVTLILQDKTFPDQVTLTQLISDCSALLKGKHRYDVN